MLEAIGAILIALVILVGVILAIASTRPGHFKVARTARIGAPSQRLHGLISDLRQMNTWNPYAQRDPASTVTYRGPDQGMGAAFDFAGPKSGAGSITVTGATPSQVTMNLKMHKPFKADNTVVFTLAPVASGSATDVTWAMSGAQPLLAKAMTLFVDCDKMVGRDFETGLAQLKAIAEGG